MFAGKCLIMIRTALTGPEKSLQHYVDIIRSKPEFLITGIHSNDHLSVLNTKLTAENILSLSPDKLFETSDALIVTGKAGEYVDTICWFLKKAKHVLIFPDATLTLLQLKKLTKIADEAGVTLNLHHNTLSNAFKEKVKKYVTRPEYIFLKSQITEYQNDETYTIFKALYRYIYLIFELNPVHIVKYHVTGIPVFSSEPRIIDINLQFENGTSAHLNISSCFKEESEIIEIFGHNRMIRYEPLKNNVYIVPSMPGDNKQGNFQEITKQDHEEDVLMKFYKSVTHTNGSENRMNCGIIPHQVASAILHQIHPAPVLD